MDENIQPVEEVAVETPVVEEAVSAPETQEVAETTVEAAPEAAA